MGDIEKPYFIEYPVGTNLKTILNEIKVDDIKYAEVGGATEILVPKNKFDTPIGFGRGRLNGVGSIVLLNSTRDLMKIYSEKLEFMEEESCKQCVPCRDGSTIMKCSIKDILKGKCPTKDKDQCYKLIADAAEATSICAHGKALGSLYRAILDTAKTCKK